MVLGVIWAMTEKPGTGEAIAAVVIGYGAGVAIAFRFARAPRVAAQAVQEANA
jgi:hypothetical protein